MLLLAIMGSASAQDVGFDAHGFHLAAHDADLRDPLTLQRPDNLRVGDWFAGGLMEYAESPLIAVDPQGNRIPILDNVLAANISVGGVVHERLRMDLGMPVFISSVGREAGNGADPGDMRLSSMVAILRQDDLELPGVDLGVGLVPFLDVPTGTTEQFLGQGTVAGGVLAATSAEVGAFTGTANVGTQFNPQLELNNLPGADTFVAALGGGFMPTDQLGFNAEVHGQVPMKRAGEPWTATAAEVLGSVRHVRDDGSHMTGGFAAALTPGAGAAAFRVFIGGGFGTSVKPDPEPEVVIHTPPPPKDPVDLPPLVPETGGLLMVVTLDGLATSDANINLVGPTGIQQFTSDNEGTAVPAEVGTKWTATTSLGSCLSATAEAEVGVDQTYLHLPLERDQSSLITVQAFDLDGEPVSEDAVVVFVSDDPYCVPGVPIELDANGSAVVALGPGTHTVLISAGGYQDYEQTVTLKSGGATEVIALLEGG